MPLPLASALHLPLVRDLAAWDRAIAALAARDVDALFDLIAEDALLPIAVDTPLAVEEDLATLARVRVLDGPAAGAVGWIPTGAGAASRVLVPRAA